MNIIEKLREHTVKRLQKRVALFVVLCAIWAAWMYYYVSFVLDVQHVPNNIVLLLTALLVFTVVQVLRIVSTLVDLYYVSTLHTKTYAPYSQVTQTLTAHRLLYKGTNNNRVANTVIDSLKRMGLTPEDFLKEMEKIK